MTGATIHYLEARDARQERLWLAYVEARRRADDTLSLADARQAGEAWAAFLREFER